MIVPFQIDWLKPCFQIKNKDLFRYDRKIEWILQGMTVTESNV